MKYPDIIGSSDKKFRNYRYKTNVSGNYSPKSKATGKAVAKYSKVTAAKGKLRQMAGKVTAEQKFLGKTLPKTLFKVGKFAITNPITTTGLFLAGGQLKKLGQAKSFNYPQSRQFNRKGRKIT